MERSAAFQRAASSVAPSVAALKALWDCGVDEDPDALAQALLLAVSAAVGASSSSLVLVDALRAVIETRTLPPFADLDKRARLAVWAADEAATLVPSRRCVAILHERLREGTLFTADRREHAWIFTAGGYARPPHMLLALTALDVLLYWPCEERDAPDTVAFLRAALRSLVCAFLYTYEVRIDAPVPVGGKPQYIHMELGPSSHIVTFLLQRVLAPDCAHIVRGAVQPLTLHALRQRLLLRAVGQEAAFASGVDNTRLR